MQRSTIRSSIGPLAAGIVLLLGLPNTASGHSGGVPFAALGAKLDLVLERLDEVEAKIGTQSTDLRGVTQSWDKKLDSTNGDADGCNSDRFSCLFGDTVVRDNETGLVWDRSPDATDVLWGVAVRHCINREVGGRKGFHLPLIEQLATLVDTGNSNPALPSGHPFLNVQPTNYWSATTNELTPVFARNADFSDGSLTTSTNKTNQSPVLYPAWCVRGGQSFDGNTHDSLH